MMTSLLDLPNELILLIGEACFTGALNSLIRTNRRLAELLDPILWKFQSKRDPGITVKRPKIETMFDLISYADRNWKHLMLKKCFEHFNFDRQDTATKNEAFRIAINERKYGWLEMLLNGMEKQDERFDIHIVSEAIQGFIGNDDHDLGIAKRLLQHVVIERNTWKGFVECAMYRSREKGLRVVLDCSQCDPLPKQADLNRLLFLAAFIGHVPSIALLARRGADVNMPGLDKMCPEHTPPIIAARRGKMEAAIWMFQHGAYINVRKLKKMRIEKTMIRKLGRLYSSISHEPAICQRACCDFPRLTRELYAGHCDSSSSPPSHEDLQPGAGFGVKERQFERYILSLAFAESPETVSLLLDKIDVAKMGDEILFRASYWRGNRLLIKELVARGVSLAARRKENNILHYLVKKSINSAAEDKIQHVIDAADFIIDIRPEVLSERGGYGNTPLHFATNKCPRLFTALLKRGASADVQNDYEQTPRGWIQDRWWKKYHHMFSQYL